MLPEYSVHLYQLPFMLLSSNWLRSQQVNIPFPVQNEGAAFSGSPEGHD